MCAVTEESLALKSETWVCGYDCWQAGALSRLSLLIHEPGCNDCLQKVSVSSKWNNAHKVSSIASAQEGNDDRMIMFLFLPFQPD